MSSPSQITVLCEDRHHASLVTEYLKKCGIDPSRAVRRRVASEVTHGGNIQWVIEQFSQELKYCSLRNRASAKTLLVVVADADELTVEERKKGFELGACESFIVLLIPKRNIETWICVANKIAAEETSNYKNQYRRDQWKAPIRDAAKEIYTWARSNTLHEICVPSLSQALPEWRKIG